MLLDRLGKEVLLFDGAMGSQLQQRGLKPGMIPEELNISDPEMIIDIHSAYLQAGADFVTPSFSLIGSAYLILRFPVPHSPYPGARFHPHTAGSYDRM